MPWTGNDIKHGSEYGSGIQLGSPKDSSTKIETHKIGDTLTMGRSYVGSDGKSS